jgi:mannose-6-phosphate isomerase-like protein (cupin superfamily)
MTIAEQPVLVPYDACRRRLWGDPEAGILSDWFYARSLRVNVNIFSIPGAGFAKQSAQNKCVFGADEVFYVLEGTLVINNPETGETYRVNRGEAAFFRKDTYNYAFNHGLESLRGLEFFHPTPDSGAGRDYVTSKAPLEKVRYGRDELIGCWPMAREQARDEATIWVIGERDYLWRLEGEASPLLTGLLISTEHSTIGKHYVVPAQRTDELVCGGDKVLFVEEGALHVEFPESRDWFELGRYDGIVIPEGLAHRYYNESGSTEAKALFVVAPGYLPTEGA